MRGIGALSSLHPCGGQAGSGKTIEALRNVANKHLPGVRRYQCAAPCHAHGVELVPHQMQPTIGHAANMHLMATVNAPCQAGRGIGQSRRRNALFKLQNGGFPVPSGPVSASTSSSTSSRSDAGPPVTDLRLLRHGMARRSDVHRISVTAGPPTTGIADGTNLDICNEAIELEQRHGQTDRNACALRR